MRSKYYNPHPYHIHAHTNTNTKHSHIPNPTPLKRLNTPHNPSNLLHNRTLLPTRHGRILNHISSIRPIPHPPTAGGIGIPVA
ncbi:hypothetical protein CC2G_008027 [Coprinopsis cinerea AmutBmut pab1-1]|nr:hypothetical protein CC2G_008027 [Coprinopsis cinerea AmutBmut pab1-1]